MIVVAFGAAAFTGHGTIERVLTMAVAVGAGAGAALIRDWRYGAALGLIGYLLYVGFLVNQYGELTWSGQRTLWDALLFAFAYVLGLGQRWIRAEPESGSNVQQKEATEAQIAEASR